MTTDSEQAKAIFLDVIESVPKDRWDDYLAARCQDEDVRQRVHELLRAHDGNDSFFDHPPATVPMAISESPGDQIGQYKLLQNIGEGGFGVVFMAEQTQPVRRKVALKVIKPGMDTKEVIARFEAERQALAIMDHPNIAKVFDGGATDSGRPYFVMELVKGVPLTQYADANQLSTEDRLALFSQVCRAVHHAHQKGIIHRDLKPSNVLVTLHDGVPVPKIIDFGVSKAVNQPLTEKTMFTQYGQVIGTPQYMSPEQAEMSGLDIDTRSDVYSLGVMLYELLTGQTLFSAEEIRRVGLDEMRRVIREQEPVRPSNILETFDKATATVVASHRASRPEQLRRSLRGELDWIVLKALEKDRNRRYDTAISFAHDVENHLHHEPVSASPPTFAYQCAKFYQRYRGACKAAFAIAALLLGATTISTAFWLKAERSKQQALLAMHKEHEAAKIAENAASAERTANASARSTLSLLIRMLSKAGTNPKTNQEFTVSEALFSLATAGEASSSADENDANELGDVPANVLAELHREMGKAYARAGRRQLALEHLQIARDRCREVSGENSPQFAECLRFIGEINQSTTTMLTAIEIYQSLGLKHEALQTRVALGKACWKNKELLLAEEQLRIACKEYDEVSPKFTIDDSPQLILSRVYRQRNDIGSESDWFEKAMALAVEAYGNDVNEWFRIATSYYESRRFRESEFAFRVVLKLNEKRDQRINDLALFRLSVSYRSIGNLDRAIECMTETYEATSAAESTWAADRARALGALYLRKGDFAKAALLFADAVRWELRKSTNTDDSEISQLLLVAERSSEAKAVASQFAKELDELELDDEINRMNLESTLRYMRLAGHEVGSGQERILGNRLHLHVNSLERDGAYDAALAFAAASTSYLDQIGNKEDAAWQKSRCSRLQYQCLDFSQAVKSQREAVALAQTPTQREWLNFELAMILYFGGQHDEAKELAARTFREVHQLNVAGKQIAHKQLDRFCLSQLAVMAHREDDARKLIESLKWMDTDGLEGIGIRWLNLALGMVHEEIGNPLEAINSYEVAVKMDGDFPSYPQYQFDDRLIELLDETDQLDRGTKIFTAALATRRKDLPDHHPLVGLTQMRLAEVMIRAGEQPREACELLETARQTMARNRITPQPVFDRIDRLTKQAKTL